MEADTGPGGFAVALRRLRESRSLTQEELAERSGVTAKAISALERGERRRPYPHTVRSLADGLRLEDDERAGLLAAVPSRSPMSSPPEVDAPPPAPEPSATAVPSPTGPTFGRSDELRRILDLVAGTTGTAGTAERLVTLTGPGGVGKTRLATEVLTRAGGSFPDGTTFVDLSPVRDPAVVLPRIATALGVVEGAHAAGLADHLAAHLAGRRVLVVLDNLEQVLAAAPAVADLLARAPGLTVVATSRAPLRVRAEREVPVGPLALPEDDEPASVSASPAISVFLDRAAATGVQWAVTPETAATLAGIVRRLDGLPLALELAAAGARVLPPEALLARLEHRGLDPGLGDGPRDLPDRQRTMTTVLDWSADLLEPEEWDLLMRLSVFSGGFSLDSVDAVVGSAGGAQGSDDVLPALTSLVEQSLVVPVAAPDRIPRFRLLEPVRQYAAVRAQAAGVALPTAEAHAAHFRELAGEAHGRLLSSGIGHVLDRLDADHANLRSAYLRLLELDRHADAADLTHSLWLHLGLRGYAREGLGWLDGLAGAGTDAAVVRAAVARMGLMLVVGDVAGMRREAAVALPLAHRVGDPTIEGEARVLAGLAAVFAGDLAAAAELLRPDLQLPGGDAGRWISLHFLIGLGQRALVGGDVDTAQSLLRDALAAARELGNEFALATTLNTVATLREVLGDDRGAAMLLGESLRTAWPLRLTWTIGYAVPALAGVAARSGDHEAAATLFGAAATLGAATAVDPHFPPSRETADAGLVTARDALGERAFLASWEVGRSMTAVQVAELAGTVVAEITDRGRG
ncbi:helix-turn-helix domain-containing protein [Nocardioides cavernae]|uniref:Helix-turn-helix domain-containing protein n=1 Tax=Nocardioides cavernae TaxID=1921566 RepID=A0ABR8N8I8_9ACTN|nr:helix-turn-helix domain-containing protein [Nocardioides cavernae]MBD3924190.1 helix-turn-helix domain-containing protein [Nocardioides cavernae]MBM7510872.1 putative ATPase/transcriptional regulator with XRE-family HTH domain [Nocardioides cavernae]